MVQRRRGWRWWALRVVAAAVVVFVARWGWERYRPLPPPTPGDVDRGEQAFLSSDLGSKNYSNIPRALYEALPVLFPEQFVEGWQGFGVLENPDDPKGPPIGSVRATVLGVEAYATNCAMCHVGKFRGQLVRGAPNFDLDIQRMVHALNIALDSDTLTVDAVAEIAEKNGRPLSRTDRWGIGAWLAFARRKQAQQRKNWFKDELGPGRSDALNQWKRTLGVTTEEHVSWVDIPPIFNQRLKTRTLLDGSVTGDPAVRIMLTELQKGRPFRDPLLHREVFDDIAAYVIEKLDPPKNPFPIDAALSARGREVFRTSCATCHGTYDGPGPRTYPNKRIDVSRVGTDPERALAMTSEMQTVLDRYEYKRFLSIDPKPAYMPPPLDGVWMTAPYLHNGSVPTLWHVLHPDLRPVKFARHFNDYDPVKVGLVCDERHGPDGVECGPDEQQKKHDPRTIWTYDTRKKGNLSTGHTFGADLPEDEKTAVLEYLKTL